MVKLDETLSETVKKAIDDDLSLQDAISRKYANYTAIARLIQPRVEKNLKRKVNFDSLITSVKRVKPRLNLTQRKGIEAVLADSTVIVRTDVAKLIVEKSKRALQEARLLIASYQEDFLQVSESNSAITMVFDQKLLRTVCTRAIQDFVVEGNRRPTLRGVSPACVVHQHAAHQLGCYRKELCPGLPIDAVLSHQPEEGFIYQSRGL